MTNSQIPSYSGVTINISNPTVNATPYQTGCAVPQVQQATVTNPIQAVAPQYQTQGQAQYEQPQAQPQVQVQEGLPQAYPPTYYMNNYNYQQNADKVPQVGTHQPIDTTQMANNAISAEEDMTSSKEIIDKIEAEQAKQKELEEKGKPVRVVTLTDEYIMSLEKHLNNQNSELRVMAAKEVLARLDEDKTRYDDAALNALLNKMLQDPNKLVRIAALSAFSSGLAGGNDFTIQLLNDIQNNPNSSKEDVVEAANILLKMSAGSEVRYVDPNTESTKQQQLKLQQQLLEQQKVISSLQQKSKDK